MAEERTATLTLPSGQALHYRERLPPASTPATTPATTPAPSPSTSAPVVFLSANPGDSLDYAAVVPAVTALGYRTLALDWPGYGGSPVPADPAATTPATFYDRWVEFADALALPPVVLVGNSVGGFVATRFAAEHPERVVAVVLVSPGGFTPHTWLTRAFCRWQGGSWSLAPRTFAGLYIKRGRSTPVVRGILERAAGPQAAPAVVAMSRSIWRFFIDPAHDLRTDVAPRVRCPTVLVFGRNDPVIPASTDGAEARRVLPNAALHALDTGHEPFAEDPDAFLAILLPFLKQVAPSAA